MFCIINKINVNHYSVYLVDGYFNPRQRCAVVLPQCRSKLASIQYLHHNFNILKQCLVKLQEMEGSLGQEKNNLHAFSNRLSEVEKGLAASKKDHEGNSQKIRELQNNVGD